MSEQCPLCLYGFLHHGYVRGYCGFATLRTSVAAFTLDHCHGCGYMALKGWDHPEVTFYSGDSA